MSDERTPWNILGIAETASLREIKSAFAHKLKVTRPENDPAAFQALVDARDLAIAAMADTAPSSVEHTSHVIPLEVDEADEAKGESDAEIPTREILESFRAALTLEATRDSIAAAERHFDSLGGLPLEQRAALEIELIEAIRAYFAQAHSYRLYAKISSSALHKEGHDAQLLYALRVMLVLRAERDFGWIADGSLFRQVLGSAAEVTLHRLFLLKALGYDDPPDEDAHAARRPVAPDNSAFRTFVIMVVLLFLAVFAQGFYRKFVGY